jgi:tetraacyldisaccharide 4'-kinase
LSWPPLLELGWARLARVERTLIVPPGMKVITVGGATLGGSGKTPLAIAFAKRAARAERVALISHAYGARSRRACWVHEHDDATVVGDEAVLCAEALRGAGARVVSGVDRQACVELARTWATLLVLDGVAQLAPRRADWSVLVVDHDEPWGAGACPPRGDLRAPRDALLSAADTVVSVRTDGIAPKAREATWRVSGARHARSGRQLSLDELRRAPFTLVTNVARPRRVVRTLRAHGLVATAHVELMDHSSRTPSHVKNRFCLAPDKVRQATKWPDCAWIVAELELSPDLNAALDRITTQRSNPSSWTVRGVP